MTNFFFLASFFLASAVSLPEGGTPVFSDNPIASLPAVREHQFGTLKKIELTDEDSRKNGIRQAIRCEITGQPQQSWDIQFQFRITRKVVKNEVLLARFWARSIDVQTETGSAVIRPLFEMAGPPHNKSLSVDLTITPEWKEYFFPFKSLDNYDAGKAGGGFHLGFPKQTVEIAGYSLLGFGAGFDMKKLPQTPVTYEGMEPDAAWRKEAEKRIEKIRKGDLTITVADSQNQPVSGAEVEVRMKRHAFGWGSAVVAQHIMREGADFDRYREIIEKYFTRVVFENDLKWGRWENESNRERTLQAAQWLRDRNIEIRGHCLVWPSWRHIPRDVETLANDKDALRRRIDEHIKHEVTTMKGLLVDWDVINEPYNNNDVMKVLGDEEMVRWFKLARQYDPKVNLYLNDFAILTGGGKDTAHQDHFEKTLKFLKDNGVPITGLGMQSHFGGAATPPEKMLQILDRFAKLGLDISITEHDIESSNEEFQADFTRDFLITTFSHPSVVAILGWGFWERSHWKPNAAYYRADWSITPAGQVWLDLVTKKWWTNVDGKTTADGTFNTRGFLGNYEIAVKKDGKTKTVEATIPKEGTVVKITL
ncbi:MAG: endo-1,4-beta-xylanase [Planctomycetaceae bacterium]|nr:endo-1,4-beta-xylanase [Planctomycetaceae bacterium]